MKGTLKKMRTRLDKQNLAHYSLPLGDDLIELNPLIGKQISLTYSGNILCGGCGKKTKKSYAQGFCYVCMNKLAQCDMCVMKPETCHYAKGTCREPDWGDKHCNIPHFVYLSNTSAVKVGITRNTQLPVRWIDQGATQGLVIFKVATRHISGLIEVELAKIIGDKTHWQAMLKGNADDVDLVAAAQSLMPKIQQSIDAIMGVYGEKAIEQVQLATQTIRYPVDVFPQKIKSLNFDKEPLVKGTLQGIKGQYLIFDTGVINIRKYTSYEVEIANA